MRSHPLIVEILSTNRREQVLAMSQTQNTQISSNNNEYNIKVTTKRTMINCNKEDIMGGILNKQLIGYIPRTKRTNEQDDENDDDDDNDEW